MLFSLQIVSESSLTLWTVAHQLPLFMGFPSPIYCSRFPFHSPGDLPNPEIKPTSPALAGKFFTTESWEKKKQNCASHVALVKSPPANAGKVGLILGLGTSSGGGNGNALLYSWRYQVVVTKIILKKKKYRKAKLFIEEGLQIARKDEKQNAKEKENAITN